MYLSALAISLDIRIIYYIIPEGPRALLAPGSSWTRDFFLYYTSLMNRVVFLVDGFNLYHAIASSLRFRCYKWLDLVKLTKWFARPKDSVVGVYYFTALVTWNAEKLARHRTYIRALQSRGVNIVYGEFKRRDHMCRLCNRVYQTFEEKQTDVNIAIHLFRLAVADDFDTAVIVSGDSDLIPSMTAVRQTFPAKQIRVVIPIGRAAEALKKAADFSERMKEVHLRSSLFPLEIDLGRGEILACPHKWR